MQQAISQHSIHTVNLYRVPCRMGEVRPVPCGHSSRHPYAVNAGTIAVNAVTIAVSAGSHSNSEVI